MLHFAAEQVFWECRTATACESLPNSIHHKDYLASGKIGEAQALPENASCFERNGVVASKLDMP